MFIFSVSSDVSSVYIHRLESGNGSQEHSFEHTTF